MVHSLNTAINIKSLTRSEFRDRLSALGLAAYRADQVLQWIYARHAVSFDAMTNIGQADQEKLSAHFYISAPRIIAIEQSADGTRKFLFQLEDGHTIESVLIPDEDRRTLCISSQVGCGQACRFCLTGAGGFVRNLAAYEIADQVLEIAALQKKENIDTITNIVLMGMGEPLANPDEVLKALDTITAEHGLAFSPRRVTVSTSGLVPGIERLGASGLKVSLAVSLNATTDEVRDRIMPVNKRHPIKALLAACRKFPLEPRRRITFEYVMLAGVNDSIDDAERLARLLRGIKCKINLIPFNPFPGSELKRPNDATVRRFQKILQGQNYTAPIRESRGQDISAACGQLRERKKTEAKQVL
jgi:23S rRNA (adenine2503-C2)-methyltransferase